MPYVLKHKQTSQIATDILINKYDLPYYGTKYWDDADAANAAFADYLASTGLGGANQWDIVEIEENAMKLFNVKLKNDSSLRLFVDEQMKPIVERV